MLLFVYARLIRLSHCTAPQFAKDVKRGKGGNGIFLDPWWLFGPGHEVTANKRLWDLGAELVDNIPHSKEVREEPLQVSMAERKHDW